MSFLRRLLPVLHGAQPVSGGAAPQEIRLIPYGCTKFRISMFPVTPKVMGNNDRIPRHGVSREALPR